MPIRLRGTRWQVDVAYKGLRRQEQAADEVAANRREGEILLELKDEIAGKESKRWALGHAVDKTMALVWKGSASEQSAVKNATLMMAYFGKNTQIKEIDTDWVDRWVGSLEKLGNSGGTINRKLACLSKVLSVAIERGALEKKPRLDRKTEAEGRIRWISIEEEKTILGLLAQWEKHDHKDFMVLLLDTGCRPGEGYRLTSRDIDLTTGLVSFWETKNGKPRSIPMTLRVREILQRRSENSVRPFPFNDGWMRNQWDRVKAKLGFTEDTQFVPYCLRHTCASRLVQRGVPLAVIQKWMGHKTIQITLRYAHLAPADLLAGARALEQTQGIPVPSVG